MDLCFLEVLGVEVREEVSVKKVEAVRLRLLRRGVDMEDVGRGEEERESEGEELSGVDSGVGDEEAMG